MDLRPSLPLSCCRLLTRKMGLEGTLAANGTLQTAVQVPLEPQHPRVGGNAATLSSP